MTNIFHISQIIYHVSSICLPQCCINVLDHSVCLYTLQSILTSSQIVEGRVWCTIITINVIIGLLVRTVTGRHPVTLTNKHTNITKLTKLENT